ncbi:rod shape-determining protein MreC [Rickettsia amblyommatis]|uniref:Cell shape-determining protein MreC n=2 Tax=Rickettsia amblyommatis TaxID=33989 RepID=H8K317_RICAG|nr:rod shape-determining protein MreC [Rickettsia amblyommatis]AFC70285.1 rod shape-determining protein MreC [Rickettsia amblyommatis str. GAT-30V]ALA62224.1 rod shape-determining protein MreC [Rickettsia amblyommatis]ARD87287.1 rod shape-determining protein MreC [Rickettsia amblyommatis]KJV61118.1 rod shape-determining protein MreC [Rickettsia amblyommatis str. Ac/Pa]KJV88874.1 rod shape-determining protein MreC [Rickettsia amblyommatis str. Darkwater]
MAILANRVKNSSNSLELIRIISNTLKRFFVIFGLGLSVYLFFTTPKKISSISLEVTGSIVSTSLAVYEDIFEYINSITQKFVYFQDLERKNIELKLEIARLQHLQSEVELVRAENIALKDLLTIAEEEEVEYITAKLLSVSFNPFSRTALISAGKKQGIEPDQIVVNSGKLVGKVIEVSNNYAQVMLISDVNSRIPIKANSSREQGILAGNNNNSKILYLPNNHLVQKDEEIVTSGHGNIYPAGILVGYVSKVTEHDVMVNVAADLSKTEFVQVLLPKE